MDSGSTPCPACGATSAADARFCRGCGVPRLRICARCSAPLGPEAHFCKACGARAGEAPKATTAPARKVAGRSSRVRRTRKAPVWLALSALAVVIAAAGGLAWVLFLDGGGDGDGGGRPADAEQQSTAVVLEEPPPNGVDDVNGLPLRGRIRLEHPSGAAAEIPGGASLYGEAMDLRRVELADDPWWEHGGFGWEFVSFVGVPIEGAAKIDLPGGEPGSKLIVRTASGFWSELPSESITLKDGRAGVRVTVQGVPAPWTFALAAPKAGAPFLTAEERDDLRLETLYWTDRTAWEKEIDAWLATEPLAVTFGETRWASQQPPADVWAEYDRVRAQMRFTLKMFGAARRGLDNPVSLFGGDSNPTGQELSAQELWAGGVQRLAVVKQNWLAFRGKVDVETLEPARQVAIYFVDQWIETAMHDYAPWGIDLVKAWLDGDQLKGFDLAVLKPYGELKWVDIVVAPGDVPTLIEAATREAEAASPPAGTPGRQFTLRLYSVRAMERLAVVDWLKENVDWIVRWLPVALAATGLIPGAVGLSFAFAMADQVLNWANDWYTSNNEHPYAYLVMEGVSAGGISGGSFVMDMAEERVLMKEAGRGMLPAHGLTIAQFAYSVGMFAAVRGHRLLHVQVGAGGGERYARLLCQRPLRQHQRWDSARNLPCPDSRAPGSTRRRLPHARRTPHVVPTEDSGGRLPRDVAERRPDSQPARQ